MYYLSERTVSNAYSSILSTKTPNKFWGLLSIIHEIDSYPIKVNHTYILPTKKISLWLDEILYFGNENKDYGERDCFVRFPNEWIENIADPSNGILKSDKTNILDVACFIYKLSPFEKEYSASELIAKLRKEFNLSEEMVSSWFVYSHYELSYTENTISKSSMLGVLKEVKSDLTDCISFEVPIKSRPGEMTRAPFIQTLYAGTNALKCLMFATYNLEELYPTSRIEKIEIKNMTLQQIYYGAPGTGKSHEINRLTEGEEVIRTTFHPDSDYSTFVGCYKPHMDELDMTTVIGKELIVVKDENGQPKKEKRIVYKYSCQAFLQAYTAAWQHPDKAQYLVIEEINRGNCAQIFGDIFQLLDRNDEGYSAYPIKTDADAEDELRTLFAKKWKLTEEKAKEIDDLYRKHYPDGITKSIKDGSILLLPSNLYIWATMNTSDQSLFPIDSAFKRRWDWKYVKIAEGRDSETKVLLNWVVKFDYEKDNKSYTFECSWWEFIKAINEKIAAATSSDDKKLGYFFCKPKTQDSKEIDAERFVGKVVFYLWNDVFKDEDNAIFKVVEGKGDPSFDTFYMEDDNGATIADTKALRAFMHNVFGDQSNLYTETSKETTDTAETATE